MEMFLKLFFLITISCTHAEPLLNTLYGLNGRIQVTACSMSGAHCEGVVLLADWVAVPDSCIRAQSSEHMYVQTGIVNCTQETTTMGPSTRDSSVRSVVERFSHPLAPSIDLALLRLEWPYVDEIGNDTLSYNSLNMYSPSLIYSPDLLLPHQNIYLNLDIWMEGILYSTTENINRDHTESYTQTEYHMYSSPIRMFFATVILPSVSFILFFLFIVFFTGTTDDTRMIPYKTLNNDKDSSHV